MYLEQLVSETNCEACFVYEDTSWLSKTPGYQDNQIFVIQFNNVLFFLFYYSPS